MLSPGGGGAAEGKATRFATGGATLVQWDAPGTSGETLVSLEGRCEGGVCLSVSADGANGRRTTLIILPIERFGGLGGHPALDRQQDIPASSGPASLLRACALSFVVEARELDARAAGITIEALARLLSVAVCESRTRVRERRDERFAQARDFIESRLAASGLTGRLIAANIGVSPRQLNCLFEQAGTSVAKYILSRRLAVAEGMLRVETRTIAEIAFTCGFGSLRTFYRAFRAAHGVSARDFRAAHMKAPASPSCAHEDVRAHGASASV
jgi:AraC-like DNA-binding protein